MSLRSMSKALLATLAGTLLSCGFATNALAGDTTELIDVNTLEVDPAFGISSMNKNHKPSVFTELGIVYGVLDGLNVSASVSYETEYGLAGGSAGFGAELPVPRAYLRQGCAGVVGNDGERDPRRLVAAARCAGRDRAAAVQGRASAPPYGCE